MRRLPALPLVLALALVATACADDRASAPSPTPSTSTPTTEDSPEAGTATATPSPTATTSSPSPSPTTPSPSPSPAPPDPDAQPASADELAERLVAAEQAIRDPEISDEALRGWAHVQHAAYRTLHDRPDWVDPVREQLPAQLHEAFDANLFAQSDLFALTDPKEQLPDWRIVPAPPADELLEYYRAAGEEFGIDWTYLAAIHLVESRMGRIRGDSDAGAQGPMQFLPSTWEDFGEGDIQDPQDAIRAAARYLVAHGAPEDMPSALWAYNHSDLYVNAIEAYARVMRDEPSTYEAYYNWRIYYRLVSGDVVLEEGWTNPDA